MTRLLHHRGPHHGEWGRTGRPPIPLEDPEPALFPPYDRPTYVCSKCGDVFYANAEYMDPEWRAGWLVHPERNLCRCPRHLGRYQLEAAGLPARRKDWLRWVNEVRTMAQSTFQIDPTAMPWQTPDHVWEACFGEPHPLSESEIDHD